MFMKGAAMLRSVSIYPLTLYTTSFFLIYFLPFIIARWRGHSQSILLGFMNLLFGWTVLVWIFSLFWALCHQHQPAFNRRCPHCAEVIGHQAKTCHFCGNELVHVHVFEKICLICRAGNRVQETYCAACSSRLL